MNFDIDELSVPAKAEAMRYGHVAIVNKEELIDFLDAMAHFLDNGEHFSVTPLSKVAGSVLLYSIRIIPVIRIKTFKQATV